MKRVYNATTDKFEDVDGIGYPASVTPALEPTEDAELPYGFAVADIHSEALIRFLNPLVVSIAVAVFAGAYWGTHALGLT